MSEFVVLLERLIGWAELWGMGTDSHSAEKLADTRDALVEYVTGLEEENARLQDRLVACEASLVGMVQQYCGYRDDINPDATYHHDFMSAGENAFRYLLAHHIATLADNGVDIRFPEVE